MTVTAFSFPSDLSPSRLIIPSAQPAHCSPFSIPPFELHKFVEIEFNNPSPECWTGRLNDLEVFEPRSEMLWNGMEQERERSDLKCNSRDFHRHFQMLLF